jgi:hypothetical protein
VKLSRTLVPVAVALGLSGLAGLKAAAGGARVRVAPAVRAAPPAAAAPAVRAALAAPSLLAPRARLQDDCEDVALAIKAAAEHEANADYWIKLANCINDPDCDFDDFEELASEELEEALEEAEEQYEARLDLCDELGPGPYAPDLDPSAFSTHVDNTYFPLILKRTYVYEKQTDEGLERLEIRALNDVVDIDGFLCRAVAAREYLEGELKEDTIDWFAQRSDGTVWYFGEISKEFEDGFLESIGGSWRAGKDGAQPGIIMLADPQPGVLYRQEYLPNEAEDVALVLSVDETVTVPYGTFTNCVKTQDGSPLEPGNFEWKYYAPGVGLVLEEDPVSGERLELIKIKR